MNAWQLHPQLANDTVPVIELALCEVRLMDDANHPWLVLVPRIADMVEIIDLDPAQRSQLTAEIDAACRALKTLFKPDKLTVLRDVYFYPSLKSGNVPDRATVNVVMKFDDDGYSTRRVSTNSFKKIPVNRYFTVRFRN